MELFISVLPVFIIGYYIYKKDSVKEPIKLLIKLLFCGIASAICSSFSSLFLSDLVDSVLDDVGILISIKKLINVFIVTAFSAEGFKYLFLYKYGYKSKEFDSSFDIIVYSSFVSLGYALSESILYVCAAGMKGSLFGAIISIPLHTSCGILMGTMLSLAKYCEVNNLSGCEKNKFLALLTPLLVHGIYYYLIISEGTLIIIAFIVFIVCVDVITIKLVNQKTKEDKLYIEK